MLNDSFQINVHHYCNTSPVKFHPHCNIQPLPDPFLLLDVPLFVRVRENVTGHLRSGKSCVRKSSLP